MTDQGRTANQPLGGPGSRAESGFTLVEVVLGTSLALVVLIGAYQLADWSGRRHADTSSDVEARGNGRAALELLTADLQVAGYSPIGLAFQGIPDGNGTRVRVLADRDGDGVVEVPGEKASWVFTPAGDGLFTLFRGWDSDNNWVFTNHGDWLDTVVTDVVQVDADGDGNPDPFLTYDAAPPATTRVQVAFGVRSRYRNPKQTNHVMVFACDVGLRNRMLQ